MRTLTPIISIIISVVIFIAFAKPLFLDVRVLQGTAKDMENLIANQSKLNQEIARRLALKQAHGAENLERLNVLLPTTINEVNILTDLDVLARQHNLLLGNVSISKSEPAGGRGSASDTESDSQETPSSKELTFLKADISFEVIGTYDQFKSFLADIERSLVLLDVVSLGFSSGEGMLQQYSLTVRTYALPTSQ